MPLYIRKNNWWAATLQAALWKKYKGWERDETEPPHVAEVQKEACLRQTFYRRKYPALNPLNDESVHHFTRGESSEYILTELANIGVKPEHVKKFGVVARPDFYAEQIANDTAVEITFENGERAMIMLKSDQLIVELKDTVTGERMDLDNDIFKSYLRQLTYYMVMTGVERGFVSIRYNVKELQWKFRNEKGDYFLRPKNAKNVGVESWEVVLPKDDPVRRELENEIEYRGNLLIEAIKANNVTILPRVPKKKFNLKCKSCSFRDRCYNEDGETLEAREYRETTDLLEQDGNMVVGKPIEYYRDEEGNVKLRINSEF